MSNLEHLIENGLCRLSEGRSYREWREIMQQDCNWEGNENILIDNLWEICQYVIFTWDSERTFVRCKDCIHNGKIEKCVLAAIAAEKNFPLFMLDNRGEWFCADGKRW